MQPVTEHILRMSMIACITRTLFTGYSTVLLRQNSKTRGEFHGKTYKGKYSNISRTILVETKRILFKCAQT